MVLVIDVGNTNIVLGVFVDDYLQQQWRISTNRTHTEDELGIILKSLFAEQKIMLTEIKGVILSSVVPSMMFALERMIQKYCHLPAIIVDHTIHTVVKIKTEQPKEVGADRIVNAEAAIQLYGVPLIIIDFGTATTFCYINDKKELIGSAIAPGLTISAEALYQKAAKLPRVTIQKPISVIGKETVAAMQSGIFFGYVSLVEGIVRRMVEEIGQKVKVIATGGYSPVLREEIGLIDEINPDLTLIGLNMLYKKNNLSKK